MLIVTEEAAIRLAQAICADIQLYEQAKMVGHADPRLGVAAEINAGRALFQKRVDPKWFAVFEREVAAYPFRPAT